LKKYLNIFLYAVCSWLVLLFIYNYRSNSLDFGILIPTFMTIIALLTAYIINVKLVPDFYLTKKYKELIFYLLSVIILSMYVQVLFVFSIFIIIRFDLESVIPRMQDVLVIIANTWLIILAGVSVYQVRQSAMRQRTEDNLKREKSEVELQMLKSQINPHFLFNTLNSIYVLSKKKSDKTPDVVMKLSQMLDYLLYNNSSAKVEIKREIEFISDYVGLEKVRFGNKLDVQVDIDLNKPTALIEPMLLIPLVENAFKHGVKNERKKAFVHLKISDQDGLKFFVSNSVAQVTQRNTNGGIGLKNLTNRLDMLFPGKHQLTINQSKEKYEVTLHIKDLT
jgi:two-component system LytT family sensor kinase